TEPSASKTRLGADDVDGVELACFERREIAPADADLGAAELVGAVPIVDGEELHQDRVIGAPRALDGDLVLLTVLQTDEHLLLSEEDVARLVEEGQPDLAPDPVRTRDLGERDPRVR